VILDRSASVGIILFDLIKYCYTSDESRDL